MALNVEDRSRGANRGICARRSWLLVLLTMEGLSHAMCSQRVDRPSHTLNRDPRVVQHDQTL